MPRKTKRQKQVQKALDAKWNKQYAVPISPETKSPPLIKTESPTDIINLSCMNNTSYYKAKKRPTKPKKSMKKPKGTLTLK